jgi:hypothetical protein
MNPIIKDKKVDLMMYLLLFYCLAHKFKQEVDGFWLLSLERRAVKDKSWLL